MVLRGQSGAHSLAARCAHPRFRSSRVCVCACVRLPCRPQHAECSHTAVHHTEAGQHRRDIYMQPNECAVWMGCLHEAACWRPRRTRSATGDRRVLFADSQTPATPVMAVLTLFRSPPRGWQAQFLVQLVSACETGGHENYHLAVEKHPVFRILPPLGACRAAVQLRAARASICHSTQ
jgi:hypothetical protein